MATSLRTLRHIRPQTFDFIVGAICIALLTLQFYFRIFPTDAIWYTPTILFYLKVGAGLIGFGAFLVLGIYNKRYFLPRHFLANTAIMFAAIAYAITGFGTEYVGLLSKPQIYIERTEAIFWMLGSFYAVYSAFCAQLNGTKRVCLLCLIPSLALSGLIYSVLAPMDWHHLPLLPGWASQTICIATTIGWATAGFGFVRAGRKQNALLDQIVGYGMWVAAAMVGLHFFPVWHPLWTIWQFITAMAFFMPAIILAWVSARRRKFEVKPFFMYGMFLLLVPFIILGSGFAGFGTFVFGAKTLATQYDPSATKLQQIYRAHPTIHNPALAISKPDTDLFLFKSVADFEAQVETLPFSLEQENLFTTTYHEPLRLVTRTAAPGLMPTYHLINIIPLNAEKGMAGPFAITSQPQPAILADIAGVRLWTMGFMISACLLVFAILWRFILVVDQRIVNQQEHLKQAFSNLKVAEQSREDLTYMVVHDLRSPLSAIKSSLQILERTTIDIINERQNRTLTRAISATESMGTMISDMLNISKMENGQLELSYTNVHLQDLLSDRKHSYEGIAAKQNKTLIRDQDIPEGQEWISADGDLLRRIFDNLISNALRYTPRGGVVKISATALKDHVVFKVSDTGVGIPSDQLPYIFEKFTQVSSSQTQRRQGIGLGLAFCKLAVEAHGGEIRVDSKEKQGTTFTFTIPFRPAQTLPDTKPETMELQPKVTTGTLSTIKFGLPSLGQRDTGPLTN